METEKRKGGGAKLSRSETVTVRLDPKLRYLAELAARKQRRTLSSYVEWAIEDSLSRVNLYPNRDTSLADEAPSLWDVDEADRFVRLALRHPDLLTHEEQVRWKLIRENGYLWLGQYAGKERRWKWSIDEESLVYERLRKHWVDFCRASEGEPTTLPTWHRTQPQDTATSAKTSGDEPASDDFEDMDDDIPF